MVRKTESGDLVVPKWVAVVIVTVLITASGALISLGMTVEEVESSSRNSTSNTQVLRHVEKWESATTERDNSQDLQIAKLQDQITDIRKQQGSDASKLASIETLLTQIDERLNRISNRLGSGGSSGDLQFNSSKGADTAPELGAHHG